MAVVPGNPTQVLVGRADACPGLPTQPEGISAAELPGGLRHPHFWAGDLAHRRLTESHLAAAGALIAICLGAALWGMPGGDAALRWVALAGIAVASLVAIGTTVLVAADPHGEWSRWALIAAGLALLGEVGVAWLYPLTVIPDPPGHSPGVVAVHNTTWLAIGLLLGPVGDPWMRTLPTRWRAPRSARRAVSSSAWVCVCRNRLLAIRN